MQREHRRIFVLLAALLVILVLLGCVVSVTSLREASLGLTPTPAGAVEFRRSVVATEEVGPARTPKVTGDPRPVASEERGQYPDELILDAVEALTIDVYERVSPSVVHITSRVISMDFFGGLYPSEGTGSGFVLDDKGHIVTNNHVIARAETIEVTLLDQTIVKGEIVGVDPYNDLAVVRVDVDPDKLQPVDLSFSGELRVGQRALAIGNPFGLDWTLTVGVISALGRPLQTSADQIIHNVIQTDAAINPGNSGGPLLNSRGQLIGVNTAIRYGAENIGFAIPLSTVRRVVPELIENGRYRHPWLGIRGYSMHPELARRLDLPVEKGILIARLIRGGPAAKAGLRGATREVVVGNSRMLLGGDIIVGIDGFDIDSNATLREVLETQTRVGQEVEITYYRGEKVMTSRAVLTEESR